MHSEGERPNSRRRATPQNLRERHNIVPLFEIILAIAIQFHPNIKIAVQGAGWYHMACGVPHKALKTKPRWIRCTSQPSAEVADLLRQSRCAFCAEALEQDCANLVHVASRRRLADDAGAILNQAARYCMLYSKSYLSSFAKAADYSFPWHGLRNHSKQLHNF